jgi:Dickkopf N-terminal cysteine-rich region
VPTHAAFDAGTDPNRNAVQAGTICDRLATIQCAGEAHCCDAPNRTFDQCKEEMLAGCNDMALLDGIAAQARAGFDAAFAATTFTQYETMASMCDPDVTEWGASYTGLPGIFKGTVAPTKSCTPIGNLQDRALIAGYLAACTDMPNYACVPRLKGTGSLAIPSGWTCDPKQPAGSGCFTDVNCETGLYCDNPDAKIGNVFCKVRKAVGETCTNPNECATLFCKKGLCVEKSVQAAYCLRND